MKKELLLKLKILGEPKAIQSFKVAVFGGKVRGYQPKGNTDWKGFIRLHASQNLPQGWEPQTESLYVICKFYFPPTKSWTKKKLQQLREGGIFHKITKPDLSDNLRKGLLDALTGVVWKDDSIIAMDSGWKRFSFTPRICITVYRILDEPEHKGEDLDE